MPALGKSGTCRIRCLSWSMSIQVPGFRFPVPGFRFPVLGSASTNAESAVPRGNIVLDFESIDARVARPVANRVLESPHRLCLALGRDLDVAARQIPHPAGNALVRGLALGEKPEADALHAPADQVPLRDAHAKRRIIIRKLVTNRRGVSEETAVPSLKRLLVGKPIPSHLAHHERLSR